MGYDVTVHLVDPDVVRDGFVPLLLSDASDEVLERAYPRRAAGWLATARKLLQEPDAFEAARTAALVALAFASARWPYHYERGYVNLSLGGLLDPPLRIPADLCASPEPMFAALIERMPHLRGQFPTEVKHNGMPGVFIPKDKVDAAIRWLEAALPRPADRAAFRGELQVLRAARAQGLAVWEASDAPVRYDTAFPGDPSRQMPRMLAELSGEERSPHLDRFAIGVAGRSSTVTWADGEVLLVRHLGNEPEDDDEEPEEDTATLYDLQTWPPQGRAVPVLARAIRAPDGSFLTRDRSEVRRYALPDLGRPVSVRALDVGGERFNAASMADLGGRLVLFPAEDGQPAVETAAGGLALARGVAAGSAYQSLATTVDLGGGRPVLVWGTSGYEEVDGGWKPTFALAPGQVMEMHPAVVPASPDAFFFAVGGALHRTVRGQPPERVPVGEVVVRGVRRGPGRHLLLFGTRPGETDVGVLYSPDERSFIPIPHQIFDFEEFPQCFWAPGVDRLCAVSREELLSVRGATLLALPRLPA
jgi:hypothetical protein